MAMRDDASLDALVAAARDADMGTMAKIIAFAREAVAASRQAPQELDRESRTWLDANLAPPLEAEDWQGVPHTGKQIRWDSARRSFVVDGGKNGGG